MTTETKSQPATPPSFATRTSLSIANARENGHLKLDTPEAAFQALTDQHCNAALRLMGKPIGPKGSIPAEILVAELVGLAAICQRIAEDLGLAKREEVGAEADRETAAEPTTDPSPFARAVEACTKTYAAQRPRVESWEHATTILAHNLGHVALQASLNRSTKAPKSENSDASWLVSLAAWCQRAVEDLGLKVKEETSPCAASGSTNDKVAPSDKGKFRYALTANPTAQIVRVDFGSPVSAIGLTLAEAEGMAAELTRAMWELRGIEG